MKPQYAIKRRKKKRLNQVSGAKNRAGGLIPTTEFQLIRARAVDLITLPKGLCGTNCGNCRHFSKNYCKHVLIQMPVNARMCCAAWDRKGTIRPTRTAK